jgi:HPt (histidine-containing phosphotransfer) domain-containing protein
MMEEALRIFGTLPLQSAMGLYAGFVSVSSECVDAMTDALAARDMATLSLEASRLQGACTQVGATTAATTCSLIAMAGRFDSNDDAIVVAWHVLLQDIDLFENGVAKALAARRAYARTRRQIQW